MILHALTPTEWGYDVYGHEYMAIVYAFKVWRHIWLSTPYLIDVYTDHNNLTYYRHPHKINQRVAWYLMEMEEFNFWLIHKPGQMNKANALSQNPRIDTGGWDNEAVVVLPEQLFVWVADTLQLEQEVAADQRQHTKWITQQVESHKLISTGGRWFHEGRMIVGPNEGLQQKILQQYHDHKLMGHPGIANIWWTLWRDYWWPTMKQFVIQYVKGCATCQSTKPQTIRPKVPLMPVTPIEGAVPF